jgi:2-dehydro-3-deoxyphosphooctonate aldolase (KDO 8-P synthase)
MKLCGFDVGLDRPFFLISGPCVVESEQLQMDVAGRLKEITSALGIPFIFKSSYDKANRSSGTSFRGPGMDKGLEILAKVKRELKVPILTDVHTEADVPAVAKVVDVLQTPAFLSRQTDFIRAVAQSGKPVNIKKGQFMAPGDMKNVIDKARAAATASSPANAAPASATTTSYPTCARWRSCARRARRSSSTRRTACSCRGAKARAAAGSASSCRC